MRRGKEFPFFVHAVCFASMGMPEKAKGRNLYKFCFGSYLTREVRFPPMTRFSMTRTGRFEGFSLLELLVVIAVMAVMAAMVLPAVAGFSSTAGRRGAVNVLMNTFEQARVAALESGQTVYVGFADEEFPVADMQYAAFVVFREATEEERSGGRNYVVLKKWTRLPRNMAFKRLNSSLVPVSGGTTSFPSLKSEWGAAFSAWSERLPVIAFNSGGTVEQPGGKPLCVYLYEGYFSGGQENYTRNSTIQSSTVGLFEKISLSRYTGRAQLDVTSSDS